MGVSQEGTGAEQKQKRHNNPQQQKKANPLVVVDLFLR
jgi:hypothetical protein